MPATPASVVAEAGGEVQFAIVSDVLMLIELCKTGKMAKGQKNGAHAKESRWDGRDCRSCHGVSGLPLLPKMLIGPPLAE